MMVVEASTFDLTIKSEEMKILHEALKCYHTKLTESLKTNQNDFELFAIAKLLADVECVCQDLNVRLS